MKRQAIKSSNIRSVGYDIKSMVLEVEFHNGRVYQYQKVPALAVQELLKAKSAGRYFNETIRKSYQYYEVIEEEEKCSWCGEEHPGGPENCDKKKPVKRGGPRIIRNARAVPVEKR